MKKSILFCFFILPLLLFGQGYNHQWLLGSYNFLQDPKGRVLIDSNNFNPVPEFRKMVFKGTQGNICDANGNFLMSSNGVWIADATNDTMMNGSGLNPGGITPNWPNGLPMTANNIFLNYPNDSSKYILFHHTSTFDGFSYSANELYYSIIDMTLNGGLGAVVEKNDTAILDTLNWGITACKHANGRDWWVLASKHNTGDWFVFLIDPTGIVNYNIKNVSSMPAWYNVTQPVFSPDGNKFAYSFYDSVSLNSFIAIADFDRCNGTFSNKQILQVTNNEYIEGVSFSANGEYIYTCTFNEIFQTNLNTLSVDTVAIYDGFISPPTSTCCATTFWNMYLAADGKIYVSSGSGVMHITVINHPDSAGLACDVQQHAIDLQTYLYLRAVPNHPNYYLGCDTTLGCPCLITGVNNLSPPDFKFCIYPNPVTSNSLHIGYLLPQNVAGVFTIYDVTGKIVFKYELPPWSNEQVFNLPKLSGGVYNCIIKSNNFIATKKLIVIDEE